MMNLNYPVTVSMTPAFYDREHMLLRAQLKCLSRQTVKDFDVWLIDPHYQKRKDFIPELSDRFGLDIKHIPYKPALHIAKRYDCAIFNAPFVYSPSPINVRYSCYRFVKPTFIETILNAPSKINIDFWWYNVRDDDQEYVPGADWNVERYGEIPEHYTSLDYSLTTGKLFRHYNFFNFDSEDVSWEDCPNISKDNGDGTDTEEYPRCMGDWPRSYDEDSDIQSANHGMYGNIAWHREQWIGELNGTNEVITNSAHWEDMDFGTRAQHSGQKMVRRAGQIYRIQHTYGNYSQRSNRPVDHPFTNPCEICSDTINGGNGHIYDFLVDRNVEVGKYEFFDELEVWICRECKLAGPVLGDQQSIVNYLNKIKDKNLVKSPVIPKYKIGRNVQILSEKVDMESTLQGKIDVYNDSWENEYFYVKRENNVV